MATQTPKFKFQVADLIDAVERRQAEGVEEWKAAKVKREEAVKARRKEVLTALSGVVASLKKGDTTTTYISAAGAIVTNGRTIVDSGYDLRALGITDELPAQPGSKPPCFQSTIDMLNASTTEEILLTEAAYTNMVGSSCGQ